MNDFRKHLEKQLKDPDFEFEYEKQSSEREYIRALASARIEKNMTQSALINEHCEACQIDAPTVCDSQIPELMSQIPDWQWIKVDGINQLQRVFKFKNFKNAMAFSNRVAEIAEAEGHHPAILTEWGKVTVTWWSHSIKGLHRNDFIMAAKTDGVLTV